MFVTGHECACNLSLLHLNAVVWCIPCLSRVNDIPACLDRIHFQFVDETGNRIKYQFYYVQLKLDMSILICSLNFASVTPISPLGRVEFR